MTTAGSRVIVGRAGIGGALHIVGRQNRPTCTPEADPLLADGFGYLDDEPDVSKLCRRCVFVWGWRALTGQTVAPKMTGRDAK